MSKLLVVLALGATATAQIPYGHLLYANRVASTTVPATGIVDPVFGTITPLVPVTGNLTQHGSRTMAIDPLAPNTIYSITSISISISTTVLVLQLDGNRFTRTSLPVNLGVPGLPYELRVAPGFGLMLLGRGGQINRMFLRNMASGMVTSQPTPTLLPDNAADMVVIGSKAYALSEGDGTAAATSTIIEWDLVANTDRIVGSGYPPFYAMAEFAGMLLVGDGTGGLSFVDPVTGALSPFLTTGLGKLTSIAVDPTLTIFVVAETPGAWTIHSSSVATPLYTSTVPIDDLVLGPAPVATMLVYGSGCVGSTGVTPALGFTAPPAIGMTFAVSLADALPNTAALLMFGSSRTADPLGMLPRDLGIIGMPMCTQYNDLGGSLLTLAGGTGAGQLSFTIPNNPSFSGERLPIQWLCLDAAANALGATTSNGGECYVY
ncbi:MAG TPA: hypothetical protein VFZ65_12925 [Planctomycetota bacterium]|nr:hypothetical protein [Planctomycetota bacterium]